MRALAIVVIAACGARAAAPVAAPVAKSVELAAEPGAVVDVEAATVANYVTVVDFWSESCGACGVVGGMLAIAIASEPRVIVRKVDVGDGFTPVARAYKVGALPHFKVYDRRRRLRYELVGNDCLQAPTLARQLLAEP